MIRRHSITKRAPGVLTALAVTALPAVGTAQASPLLEVSTWTDLPGQVPRTWHFDAAPPADGVASYDGMRIDPDGRWEMTWAIRANGLPHVSVSYNLINTFSTSLTFSLIATLPVSPAIAPSSLMGGSTAGLLTDTDFDGVATVATTDGTPFYRGLIDGAPVLPIFPDPESWSVAIPGQTLSVAVADRGLPGPTLPGPPVLASIGVHHTFTLTPGDQVSLTGLFVVPGPSTLAFTALGLVGLALRQRR